MTHFKQNEYAKALTRLKANLDELLPGHDLYYPKSKRPEKRKVNKKVSVVSTAYPYYKDLFVDSKLAQSKAFIEVFGGLPHGC